MPRLIDPLKGLVDYVNDIKPYHTKILEVLIEYVYQDRVRAIVVDSHTLVIDTKFPGSDITRINTCGGYDSLPYDSTGRHVLISPAPNSITSYAYDMFSYDTEPYHYVPKNTPLIDHIDNTILVLGNRTNDMGSGSKIYLYSYIEDYTGTWDIINTDIINNSFYLSHNLIYSLKVGERFSVKGSFGSLIQSLDIINVNDTLNIIYVDGDILEYVNVGKPFSIINSLVNSGSFTPIDVYYDGINDITSITVIEQVLPSGSENNISFTFPTTNNGNYQISSIAYDVLNDITELTVVEQLKDVIEPGHIIFEKYTLVLPTPTNNGLYTIDSTEFVPSTIAQWPGYPKIDFPNYIVGNKAHTIVTLIEPLDAIPTLDVSRDQLYLTSFVFDKIQIHDVIPYSNILYGNPDEGLNHFDVQESILTITPNSGGFIINGNFSGSNIVAGSSFKISNISGLNGFYTIYEIIYDTLLNKTTILTNESVSQLYDISNVQLGYAVGKATFDIISNAFVVQGNYVGRFHQGYMFKVFNGSYNGTYTTLNSDYYNGYTRIRVTDSIAPVNIGHPIESVTNTSPTVSSFFVYGDTTLYFDNTPQIYVNGSSANNGTWEILDLIYDEITNKTEIVVNGKLDITGIGGKTTNIWFGYIKERIYGYDEHPTFCKITQSTLIHVKMGESLYIKGTGNLPLLDDVIAYNIENCNQTGYEFPINTIVSSEPPSEILPKYTFVAINKPVLYENTTVPVKFNDMDSHVWVDENDNMHVSFSINPDVGVDSVTNYFIHTQTTESFTWSINHNLGTKYVAVRVVDEFDNEMYPLSIEYIDDTQVMVSFISESIGSVICFADGSDWQLRNRYYLHETNTPTTIWTIVHNLNQKYVNVTIVDANDQVFNPYNIHYVDNTTLTVEFTNPNMGRAILIGDDADVNNTPDYYLHTQVSSENQWVVNHNLNQQYAIVTIINDNDDVVMPLSIEYINNNQLVIYFNSNRTGKVVVLGEQYTKEAINHRRITTAYWVNTTTNTFYYRTYYSIKEVNGDVNSPYGVIDSGWNLYTSNVPGFTSNIRAVPKTYLYQTEVQQVKPDDVYNHIPKMDIVLQDIELPYIITGTGIEYQYHLMDITVNYMNCKLDITSPTTFTIVYPIPDINDDIVVKVYKDDGQETNAYVSPFDSKPHVNFHNNVNLYTQNCIKLYGGNYIQHILTSGNLIAANNGVETKLTIKYIIPSAMDSSTYTLSGDYTWLLSEGFIFRAFTNNLAYWEEYSIISSIYNGTDTIIQTNETINSECGIIYGVIYNPLIGNEDISSLLYVNQTLTDINSIYYYHNYLNIAMVSDYSDSMIGTVIDDYFSTNGLVDSRLASSTVEETVLFNIVSNYDYGILYKDVGINTLYINKNITYTLEPNDILNIVGSSINDAEYTVQSVTYDAISDSTEVEVLPALNGDDIVNAVHPIYYLHDNVLSETQWVVNHNLNQKYVIVSTVNDNDRVMFPSNIEYVDENQLIITFAANQSGKAIVIGEEILPPTNTDNYYLHEQTTPSVSWTVNHTLNKKYVAVSVLDDNDEIIMPISIVYINNTQLVVTFSYFAVGKVICIGGTNNVPVGTRYHLYNQPVATPQWVIQHNMRQKYVNVTIVNHLDEIFIPYQIEYFDTTTVIIHFNDNYSGKAILNANDLLIEGRIEYTKIQNVTVL